MQTVNGARLPTVTDTQILGFFGNYRFLSNFHLEAVVVGGRAYPSAEHAYMAQKSLDPEVQIQFQETSLTPEKARKLGQSIAIRPDWELYKLPAMLHVLMAKFEVPYLRHLLLATGERYLEETNNWGDRFWGVCDGHGQNQLGHLLMLVRRRYRFEPLPPLKSESLF